MNPVCKSCRFARTIKLKNESHSFSICSNPKSGYRDDGKTITALNIDHAYFTNCDRREITNE